MKKILVPCDFSSTSLQAFRFACELASRSKGEIFLLNIIELPAMPNSIFVPSAVYENELIREMRIKVKKNFEKARDQWAGKLKVRLVIEKGSVSGGIHKFIGKKKIDIVVMGTHGASGIREFTIGSNAEKVVRQSPVPVICIRKAVPMERLNHIIFPTALDLTDKRVITSLQALQQFYKATMHILYVNTPVSFARDAEIEDKLHSLVSQYKLKNCVTHIYNDYNEEDGILGFASKFRNKIIAMVTHGRRGINHLLSGSVTENIVNHADCPIWTITKQ